MADDMNKFLGKWAVTSTENMEEMLQAFDMEESKRQMYTNMKFVMEYERNGDNSWIYKVHMPNGKIQTFNYTIGKEFDSTTLDGRPIKSKVNVDGGKFVEHHHDKEDPTLDAKMVREILGDELLVTAEVRNVTSVTRHKKVED